MCSHLTKCFFFIQLTWLVNSYTDGIKYDGCIQRLFSETHNNDTESNALPAINTAKDVRDRLKNFFSNNSCMKMFIW